MSREYEAHLDIENPEGGGEIKVTVLGKFEDGDLECMEVYEPKGFEIPKDWMEYAEQKLYDAMEYAEENGYQGD